MSAGSKKHVADVAAQVLTVTALALSLAACGGGGGSAGSTGANAGGTSGTGTTGGTTSGGTTGTPTVTTPTITLALVNGSTPTTSVSASGATSVEATVLDEKGQPVRGKLVTFSGDATLVTFNPPSGAVLTDATTGIAKIQVAPASLTSTGAGAISATSTVALSTGGAGISTTASLDYQLSAANLTLTGFNAGSATALNAYGNRTVSVQANINGVAATSTPVPVTFSASCGTVTPATVTTDGTGKASSTYTANSAGTPGCAGANVTITAAAAGASSANGTIAVNPTQATNIQFVSASPQLIYLSNSTGPKQAQVSFKVVDSSNSPLANQQLTVSLVNTAPGISLGTNQNTAPITVTTDGAGTGTVTVFSGTIPTSVKVQAQLATNNLVSATSNDLVVASGVPVQKASSISLGKFSIEGYNVDGQSTTVTFSLADRQSNPVPAGTTVNFVSSAGVMQAPSCTFGTSTPSCTVSIISQGTRPANGRVAILAYTPGEEDFVDANFNNVYDAGEAFTDLGSAYRDDDLSGTFTTGEFSVPQTGGAACTAQISGAEPSDGIPNTCDGQWGATNVRRQTYIVFATGTAHLNSAVTSLGAPSFTIADDNPNTVPQYQNSLPTGTTIDVAGRSHTTTGTCTATTKVTLIDNRYGPRTVPVLPANTCTSGDFIDVTITSPGGKVTTFTLTLTP